jgi:hypothetical protein
MFLDKIFDVYVSEQTVFQIVTFAGKHVHSINRKQFSKLCRKIHKYGVEYKSLIYLRKITRDHSIIDISIDGNEIRVAFDTIREYLINRIKSRKFHNKVTRLSRFNFEYFKDKEIMLLLVVYNYTVGLWETMSVALQNDKDIVYAATSHNVNVLFDINAKWRRNRKLILHLTRIDPSFLVDLPHFLKDKEIIKLASIHAVHKKIAPATFIHFMNDKEIVLNAIDNIYYAELKHFMACMPVCFRDDYDIVKTIVSVNGSLYQYISSRLQNMREIVLMAVTHTSSVYWMIPDKFKTDVTLAFEAVSSNPEVYNKLPETLRNEFRIAAVAVIGSRNLNMLKIPQSVLSNTKFKKYMEKGYDYEFYV